VADLTDQMFGSLHVLHRGPDRVTFPEKRGRKLVTPRWWCVCTCLDCDGTPELHSASNLVRGKARRHRTVKIAREVCKIDGCNRSSKTEGFCAVHATEERLTGLTQKERNLARRRARRQA